LQNNISNIFFFKQFHSSKGYLPSQLSLKGFHRRELWKFAFPSAISCCSNRSFLASILSTSFSTWLLWFNKTCSYKASMLLLWMNGYLFFTVSNPSNSLSNLFWRPSEFFFDLSHFLFLTLPTLWRDFSSFTWFLMYSCHSQFPIVKMRGKN